MTFTPGPRVPARSDWGWQNRDPSVGVGNMSQSTFPFVLTARDSYRVGEIIDWGHVRQLDRRDEST